MNALQIALYGFAVPLSAAAISAYGFVPGTAVTPEPPKYYSASIDAMQAKRRQQMEEDEILLAVLQQFVMEI